MKREILYTLKSPFRDDFKIQGFRFGSGTKRVAIVGPMRGDEVQQQFVCSQIVQALSRIEAAGELLPDQEILVVPSANPFSMNIGSRFWAMDDTDINRMFPGYSKGETTQRIAAALFEQLQGYQYGIQLASYYLPGRFVPHVRMMETGRQNPELGCEFGLPYVYVRTPRISDQTTLNYCWQQADTQAYSLYAGKTQEIDEAAADQTLRAIIRFLNGRGVIRSEQTPGQTSQVITNDDMLTVTSKSSGLLRRVKHAGAHVRRGEQLAFIMNPLDGSVRETLKTPVTGMLFFVQDGPFITEQSPVFQILSGQKG